MCVRAFVRMATLCRFMREIGKNVILTGFNRSVSLSATTRLREIIEKKEGNTLVIEGVQLPDLKEDRQIKIKSKACPICALKLDVKHTDVLILKQFMRSNGTMLPRRITGLCSVQHKRLNIMVAMAQEAGLLWGRGSKRNEPSRWSKKKLNTYYDEDTIQYKYKTHY